jgi:hypothetical protein
VARMTISVPRFGNNSRQGLIDTLQFLPLSNLTTTPTNQRRSADRGLRGGLSPEIPLGTASGVRPSEQAWRTSLRGSADWSRSPDRGTGARGSPGSDGGGAADAKGLRKWRESGVYEGATTPTYHLSPAASPRPPRDSLEPAPVRKGGEGSSVEHLRSELEVREHRGGWRFPCFWVAIEAFAAGCRGLITMISS